MRVKKLAGEKLKVGNGKGGEILCYFFKRGILTVVIFA